MARNDLPLTEQITAAARELKLARQDGGADWIAKSARELDALLDLVPRTTPQPKEISPCP